MVQRSRGAAQREHKEIINADRYSVTPVSNLGKMVVIFKQQQSNKKKTGMHLPKLLQYNALCELLLFFSVCLSMPTERDSDDSYSECFSFTIC